MSNTIQASNAILVLVIKYTENTSNCGEKKFLNPLNSFKQKNTPRSLSCYTAGTKSSLSCIAQGHPTTIFGKISVRKSI